MYGNRLIPATHVSHVGWDRFVRNVACPMTNPVWHLPDCSTKAVGRLTLALRCVSRYDVEPLHYTQASWSIYTCTPVVYHPPPIPIHSSPNKLLTSHTFTPPIPSTTQQTTIKMDSAKAAVKDFMSKSGQHDTTVHEKVAPAVKHETIERQKHEEYISAIDKEVHQDHYHTTEQPVLDKEVLPEQHHHNVIPVEHRSYEHGNNDEVEARLAKERAAYRDTVERVEGSTTRNVAPVVAGEHKHHHVHETIQPVIQKRKLIYSTE